MVIEREQLIKRITKDVQRKSKAAIANEIGMPAMTLGRILREKSKGSIDTWELIARHYRLKKAS